jgi:hypothetical protein
MTEEMLKAVLETAHATTDKEGWSTVPEGRLVTLYAAHGGVGLTVAKVERLRLAAGMLRAENTKGETYFVALGDVFGAAVEGKDAPGGGGRKAGFLG